MRRRGIFAVLIGIGFWVIAMTSFAAEADIVRRVIDQYASLAQSAEQQKNISVPGKEGWLFFGPELRFVSAGAFLGKGGGEGKQGNQTRIRRSPPSHC